jgi:hypothetical protein
VELAVSSAVLLMLLAAIGLVFRSAVAYHQRTDAQLELERATLLTLKTLTRECAESSWASFDLAPSGFVFSTPRDQAGAFMVNPNDEPAWAGLTCYSRERIGAEDVLVKRTEYFATPIDTVPEPLTLSPARTVTWFASSGLTPRVLQRNVQRFVLSRKSLGAEDGSDVLQIELGASIGAVGDRYHFSIELGTRVKPRN